jgi:hypothetical protein
MFLTGPTLNPESYKAQMKMAIFWVVVPCSLVEVHQRFRSSCCLRHQGDDGGTSTSETSVIFYQTTRHNNPEDSHLHTRHLENLKSHHRAQFYPLFSVVGLIVNASPSSVVTALNQFFLLIILI